MRADVSVTQPCRVGPRVKQRARWPTLPTARSGDTLDNAAHPSDVVYAPGDRPICSVQPEPVGPWHPGEVRAWYRYDDDWHADVGWGVGHAL